MKAESFCSWFDYCRWEICVTIVLKLSPFGFFFCLSFVKVLEQNAHLLSWPLAAIKNIADSFLISQSFFAFFFLIANRLIYVIYCKHQTRMSLKLALIYKTIIYQLSGRSLRCLLSEMKSFIHAVRSRTQILFSI